MVTSGKKNTSYSSSIYALTSTQILTKETHYYAQFLCNLYVTIDDQLTTYKTKSLAHSQNNIESENII